MLLPRPQLLTALKTVAERQLLPLPLLMVTMMTTRVKWTGIV
jgi:hypothetical protein